MVTVFLSFLVGITLQQTSPEARSISETTCPLIEHIDLSRASSMTGREICVSPGLLTGFLFDVNADVEVQDEQRFLNLSRSRDAISFMPPSNMAPGERLRLTVLMGDKKAQHQTDFLLVAHRGQATHQVHVSHDSRTRESLLQELERGHTHNQKLQDDNRRLQQQIAQERAWSGNLTGLSGAHLMGILDVHGIRAAQLSITDANGVVSTTDAISYRTQRQVALALRVTNNSDEPWIALSVSLIDARGMRWEGIRLTQKEAALQKKFAIVFIAVDAPVTELQGKATLTVWGTGSHTLSTQQVLFPQ